MTGNVDLGDNVKARFGTGNDLEIFHDGSNSRINSTTGTLYIKDDVIEFVRQADDSTSFKVSEGGSTELYHNHNKKFETTSTGVNITGTAVADSVTVDGTLDIEEVYEKFNSSASTTGTLAYETNAYGILYLTANQTANRTINFTNVNANLAIGQTLTCAVLATQGSTAYYFNAYQVDGSSVTPKWSGGTAPSAGNASSIDSYSFTIIKTADATFTVLASLTQYA